MCEMEGATLFYPDDDDEANSVISFWNETQPFSWVFVGISSPNVKRVFETVDGKFQYLLFILFITNIKTIN